MARRGHEDSNYHRAKQEGYVARSVYKLQELDSRYHLLKSGYKVLDLGCHPGSWLQFAAAKVGAKGMVLGVDIQPLNLELPPQASFVESDLLNIDVEHLRLNGAGYDLVMSDVAPRTTGVAHADAARSAELTGVAFDLACQLLKPGGNFVAKVFWSQDAAELMQKVKKVFKQAKNHKPTASQSASREIYLVGLGLK